MVILIIISKKIISFPGLLCTGVSDSQPSCTLAKLAKAMLRYKELYPTNSLVCKIAKVKFITMKAKSCIREQEIKYRAKITGKTTKTLTGFEVYVKP